MTAKLLKLMLVDDHKVVRIGLSTLFSTVPHFRVVAEAGSVAEAVLQAREAQPDVVLMDVRLPDGSGVEACRELRAERPETRVVMLTSYADDEAVIASILAGAAGYLLKQRDPERLIEAVEIAAEGGSLIDPGVAAAVLEWMRHTAERVSPDPLEGLSIQERKVLSLIARGRTNREIAAELALSEHTVKSYVSHIFQKLKLNRRAEAAAFAQRAQSQHRRTPFG